MRQVSCFCIIFSFLCIICIGFIGIQNMRNVSFLLSIEKLNRASIEDYKERFGNPVHVVNGKEALMDVHPEISEMLDGLLSTGWSAYFFFIKTIPHRYLIVVCDEDGNVVLRTWEYM